MKTTTYWNHKGRYDSMAKFLNHLIPMSHDAKTDELNLFRIGSNLYYDLHNNGLCNFDVKSDGWEDILDQFKHQLQPLVEDKHIETVKNASRYSETTAKAYERVMDAIILIVYTAVVSPYVTKEDIDFEINSCKRTYEQNVQIEKEKDRKTLVDSQ